MLSPILVTPDYGLSDVWHFNYPLKNLLSQSLKSGKLPLWTDQVGNGFPVLAEGQIGAFSPINWIIFGIFPMPEAFLVAIILAFVLLGTGTYFLAKKLPLSRPAAIVSGLFASVSGYFIVQMTHLNLLQAFSFIPWAFLLAENFIDQDRGSATLWLSMVLAQMVLIGHPQTFINSCFLLALYLLIRAPRKIISSGRSLLVSAVLAMLLSAIQLLPLFELIGQSDTIGAAARQRFINPLSPKHLLTVVDPFIFGDPSQGTYPVYGENWGMFWENLFYPGSAPLVIIVVLGVIWWFRRRKKMLREITWQPVFGVVVGSLALALGKYLPTKILFKIPPLSFTRITSRFLAFASIFIGVLAGMSFQVILRNTKRSRKHCLIGVICVLHLVQMVWMFKSYHLWVESDRWLKEPQMAERLPAGARIVSFYQSDRWNKMFLSKGWQGQEEHYYQARNSLDQNSNIIFGIKQLGIYAQQLPKRQELVQRNMYGDDVLGENIRDVFGVSHIIDASGEEFEVIENENFPPDVYEAKELKKVEDMYQALGKMNQEDFVPGEEVLWEADALPEEDEKVFVVNRSYYPGWKARLLTPERSDGRQAIATNHQSLITNHQLKIYPVNINQQAVIVNQDVRFSQVKFDYDPISLKLGASLSVLSLLGWMFLMVKFR